MFPTGAAQVASAPAARRGYASAYSATALLLCRPAPPPSSWPVAAACDPAAGSSAPCDDYLFSSPVSSVPVWCTRRRGVRRLWRKGDGGPRKVVVPVCGGRRRDQGERLASGSRPATDAASCCGEGSIWSWGWGGGEGGGRAQPGVIGSGGGREGGMGKAGRKVAWTRHLHHPTCSVTAAVAVQANTAAARQNRQARRRRRPHRRERHPSAPLQASPAPRPVVLSTTGGGGAPWCAPQLCGRQRSADAAPPLATRSARL